MPQPNVSDLHPVDPILTNFSLAYQQGEARFVATAASAPVPVDTESGTYFVFDKKYWFTDEMKHRAYGAPYAEGGFGMSTDTYATEQWGLSKPVADEEVATSQAPGESLITTTNRWLSGRALIRKERLFATAFFGTSIWTTDKTNATKWSTTSTPVDDVRTAKRTISQLTGMNPNLMICGEIVEDRLLTNAAIIDRLKYTRAATINEMRAALAATLGIDRILVAQAIYNSANENADASMTPIIDDDALVCYQDPSAGVFGATAFKCFHWAPGGGLGGVRQYYSEDRDAQVLKNKFQLVYKKVAADLGYFFSDICD